jgi:hypothetical protein
VLIDPRTAFVVAGTRPLSAKRRGVGMWIWTWAFPSVKEFKQDSPCTSKDFLHSVIPCPRARLPSLNRQNPMLAYGGRL